MMSNNVTNAAVEALEAVKKLGFDEQKEFDQAQETCFNMSYVDLVKSEPMTPAAKLAKQYELALRKMANMM